MASPAPGWIDDLPAQRLVGEFSVWSANLVRLADELKRGPYADVLHLDVADGHFAPAMLFFPDLVAAIRKISDLPIHVHLMVADDVVLAQIGQFVEAGSDLISIHLENAAVADAALDLLDQKHIVAGMVVKVETPVVGIASYLPRLRFLTLLGTPIGVKGHGLNESAGNRLREAKRLIDASGAAKRIVLAADGGIREHTVPVLRDAGAETVVLGSLAFGATDLGARMAWLYAL
jgi:ribulose-phosphate 3-epimerase